MANIANENVQILIHTTAPSRGQDDARYRALTQAYIDYDPAESYIIREWGLDVAEDGDSEEVEQEVNSQLLQELLESTQEERSSQASYQPDEEAESVNLPETSSESQRKDVHLAETSRWAYSPPMSFQGVAENADSPLLFALSEASREPSPQAPSTVADSQPDVSRSVISPSKVWERLGQNIRKPNSASAATLEPRRTVEETPQLLAPNTRLHSGRVESIDLTNSSSLDPTSFPLSLEDNMNSQPGIRDKSPNISSQEPPVSLKRKESVQDSRFENETSIATELELSSSIIETELAENPRKKVCVETSRKQDPLAVSTSSTVSGVISENAGTVSVGVVMKESKKHDAPSTITSSQATEVATPRSSMVNSKWTGKLEVQPPPPKTSSRVLTPDMLVTAGLQRLAVCMPGIYRPHEQTRDLRPMERGHWLVDCQRWEPRIQKSFWHALATFIDLGHGGWAISGYRDEAFGDVKVYCWGVTVEHIFLLLVMASEKKVIGTGAHWIAGDGQRVVTIMPS